MRKNSIIWRVYQCLKENGKCSHHQVAEITKLSLAQVNTALFRLKERQEAGKVGYYWQIGSAHRPTSKQVEVVELIAEGIYDPQDIADKLGMTTTAVSNEVARLRRMGVKVKRVYVFED